MSSNSEYVIYLQILTILTSSRKECCNSTQRMFPTPDNRFILLRKFFSIIYCFMNKHPSILSGIKNTKREHRGKRNSELCLLKQGTSVRPSETKFNLLSRLPSLNLRDSRSEAGMSNKKIKVGHTFHVLYLDRKV